MNLPLCTCQGCPRTTAHVCADFTAWHHVAFIIAWTYHCMDKCTGFMKLCMAWHDSITHSGLLAYTRMTTRRSINSCHTESRVASQHCADTPQPMCHSPPGVDSTGRVESFFDSISYNKGGSVLRMMRAYLNNRRISDEQYGLRRSLLQVWRPCHRLCTGPCTSMFC